jgi:hypothetical protein
VHGTLEIVSKQPEIALDPAGAADKDMISPGKS